MTDYARIHVLTEVDNNVDFTHAQQHGAKLSLTPALSVVRNTVEALTTGTLYTLPFVTDCTSLQVENTDLVNAVAVEWYSVLGTRAAITGGTGLAITSAFTAFLMTDSTSAGLFVTSKAEVADYVRLIGCTLTANEGPHLLSVVNANGNVLTCPIAMALGNDTTATFSFERKNKVLLPPGGVLAVSCSIAIAGGVLLTSVTAPVICRLSATGD